jgi:predicted ATP-grasp superfamily ATP-dependent carboligase
MESLLNWHGEPPTLRRPVLLVALDGFVDAGEVGQSAVMFLRHRWRADKVAELDGDSFIDYRARRPDVVVDNGRLRRVEWPRIEVFAAELDGPRDVLLLVGPEPDMRWHAFTDCVERLCRRTDVSRVVTLGAYPAATPHTRPISVAQAGNVADHEPLEEPQPIRGYTGPIGAATALQGGLGDRGVPVLGLWAEVPHYISASPNPPGVLRMVELVSGLLEVDVDVTELQAAAKVHREQVDEAVAEHAEAAEMIAGLEQLTDAGVTDGDLPSGDDLAQEIERFLRSQE